MCLLEIQVQCAVKTLLLWNQLFVVCWNQLLLALVLLLGRDLLKMRQFWD